MPKHLHTGVFTPDFQVTHHVHRHISHRGVYVNKALVQHYIEKLSREAELYTKKCMLDSFNYVSNTRSSKQVREYFFTNYSEEALEPYFMVYDYKIRDYRWTFGADNLMEFYNAYNDEVCMDIIKANQANYYRTNLIGVLSNTTSESYVHPDVKLLVTNRYSFSNPNLHSMTSKEIGGIFHVPNFTLVSFDLKQPEPKLTAYAAGLHNLLELANEFGDFYKAVGVNILGMDTISSHQRQVIKTCWNAANYGAGRDKICKIAKTDIDGEFFYNEHRNITAKAMNRLANGGIVSTLFGTPLNVEHAKPHQKIAHAIQGTVSDILAYMCETILRMADDMGLNGYKTMMAGDYDSVDDIFSIYYTMHDAPYIIFSNTFFAPESRDDCIRKLEDAFSLIIDNTVNIGATAEIISDGNVFMG